MSRKSASLSLSPETFSVVSLIWFCEPAETGGTAVRFAWPFPFCFLKNLGVFGEIFGEFYSSEMGAIGDSFLGAASPFFESPATESDAAEKEE